MNNSPANFSKNAVQLGDDCDNDSPTDLLKVKRHSSVLYKDRSALNLKSNSGKSIKIDNDCSSCSDPYAQSQKTAKSKAEMPNFQL